MVRLYVFWCHRHLPGLVLKRWAEQKSVIFSMIFKFHSINLIMCSNSGIFVENLKTKLRCELALWLLTVAATRQTLCNFKRILTKGLICLFSRTHLFAVVQLRSFIALEIRSIPGQRTFLILSTKFSYAAKNWCPMLGIYFNYEITCLFWCFSSNLSGGCICFAI